MFAWALTGKHVSPLSFLMGDEGHHLAASHSTEQNELLLIPSEARRGGVKLWNTTLLSFLGVPERGKALGVAQVVWALQLNRHLSGFQSLKWTALANPETTEAVRFSKLIELVWASCCQPFWVLGLDTNLVQLFLLQRHIQGWQLLSVVFILSSLPVLVIFAMRRLRQNWRTGKLFNHAEIVGGGFFSYKSSVLGQSSSSGRTK